MKFDKERLLRTEFGREMCDCAKAWDRALVKMWDPGSDVGDQRAAMYDASWHQARWGVFQLALREFFGVVYHFDRTDEHFGIVSGDGTDWLYRVDRLQEGGDGP